MKISHLNYSDVIDGAARAAYRIHHALLRHGLDSRMFVHETYTGDWTVTHPSTRLARALAKLRASMGILSDRSMFSHHQGLHSTAMFPTRLATHLNSSEVNVIHLHWVNKGMLSIADIGRLRKSVVWTLHDMWAFCGAEHYTENRRWRSGYKHADRPASEIGLDLNRWTFLRKCKHWRRPMHIVTPSNWLAECVRESALMRNWPVTVIPNPLDIHIWRPVDRTLARQLLHLPLNVPLLLFGGDMFDSRKGFDLLKAMLGQLRNEVSGLDVVIFGQMAPQDPPDVSFTIHFTGHLYDDLTLCLLYSAADVMVIPSRMDNLPNTGIEAHACGIPVVAFDTCGLSDIVEHKQTGYLATAFDTMDLANGIKWVLEKPDRHAMLGQAARDRAVKLWSYEAVAPQYIDVYRQACAQAEGH